MVKYVNKLCNCFKSMLSVFKKTNFLKSCGRSDGGSSELVTVLALVRGTALCHRAEETGQGVAMPSSVGGTLVCPLPPSSPALTDLPTLQGPP